MNCICRYSRGRRFLGILNVRGYTTFPYVPMCPLHFYVIFSGKRHVYPVNCTRFFSCIFLTPHLLCGSCQSTKICFFGSAQRTLLIHAFGRHEKSVVAMQKRIFTSYALELNKQKIINRGIFCRESKRTNPMISIALHCRQVSLVADCGGCKLNCF